MNIPSTPQKVTLNITNIGRGIKGWDPLSCDKVFAGKMESYV